MTGTFLIAGLGNPGPRYANTRHNIGHMVLDHLAGELGGTFKPARRAQAVVLEGRLGAVGTASSARTVLAKTTCFMNESGGPIANLVRFYSIEPENVVIVHDDIDLAFDVLRVKRGGGEGGHNGLRDITKALGTKEYLRVRAGVGRPTGGGDAADYVLAPFSASQRKDLPHLLADAADAAASLVLDGLLDTQQRVHAPNGRTK
ncbi:aminoacyl-tRNA hydrolase [Devriesea agamarum]|uniref:aminoacyl-tRNA hydrolase n=1 Tax=Devriesea agamarum TaxID=472569 RepID=UPI00071DF65A|nr:aminoacyl-tRNA hydrolase [Devriesea agamarum]